MGFVMSLKTPHKTWMQKLYHRFFNCPTFWRIKSAFECPKCHIKYRCYWDGNDVTGHGVDLCNKCAAKYEK